MAKAPKAPKELESKRLRMTAMSRADLPMLIAMRQDAEVAKTMGGTVEPAVVEKQLQTILQHWEVEDFGVYSVWSREDGSWIGRAGLRFTEQEGKREYELLYAFMPQAWGKGYGYEVASALIRMGFESLGAESIMAFTLTHNAGSRRIMEKCGMQFEREGTYKDMPHVWYRILRESGDSRDSED